MLPRILIFAVSVWSLIGVARAAGYPEFDEPTLKLGRQVWLGTCEACHANSMSEAPQVKKPAAWAPRLAKGREVLNAHALNGFTGKSGEEMPPRGGNPNLSDAEVMAALDYMLKLVTSAKEK
jgi:cytochrome c5